MWLTSVKKIFNISFLISVINYTTIKKVRRSNVLDQFLTERCGGIIHHVSSNATPSLRNFNTIKHFSEFEQSYYPSIAEKSFVNTSTE